MMMVPRAFLFTPVAPTTTTTSKPSGRNNDNDKHNNNSKKYNHNCVGGGSVKPTVKVHSGGQVPSDKPIPVVTSSNIDEKAMLHSNPVVIPPKRSPRGTSVNKGQQQQQGLTRSKSSQNSGKFRRSSSTASLPTPVASILEATAIPVPRRNWTTSRESRRLPRRNHVEDFNKLFMEGVESKGDRLVAGSVSGALGLLLSPPEEDDERLSVINDDDAVLPSSPHSMSSDSVPSLENESESPSSLSQPLTPSNNQKSPPSEKRCRQVAHPEDCAFDHPLLETKPPVSEQADPIPLGLGTISEEKPAPSLPSFPRLGATFKSNLTASLRAIKSAAHTVSTFTTPSVQPDDFLTRSFFTLTPELTDDRRPPPMSEPPSPALRRYLNPTSVSPAEMHVYHERPHDPTSRSNKCPVSIQMQTYRRSDNRSGRKKGVTKARNNKVPALPTDVEIFPPTPRQREPRENGDFLRMVVLELNMRRSGKLRDDVPIRARIWLPPRRSSTSSTTYSEEEDGTVPARCAGVSC